jgi:SAM-dependent methyltransferase
MIEFSCNICGTANAVPAGEKHRELLHCAHCRSCARFRGVVKALFAVTAGMNGEAPLVAHAPMKHIRGIGMSDADAYANELARMFDYTNTYYHTTPLLDVTNRESSAQFSNLDFVISSDVLEHVHAPVSEALRNMLAMLRPGGHLILTVPYLEGYETIEHFPHLHNYEIVKVGGDYVLANERRDGSIEVHRNLCFHGGPGSVLEMRIFGEGDLISMLRYAGFDNVRTLIPDDSAIGYCWDDVADGSGGDRRNKSHVLICRRPLA